MSDFAVSMKMSLPARAAIAAVLNSNKNKVFYAADLYKEVIKMTSVTYTSLCSALSNFPSVRVKGSAKYVYGNTAALKKLKKEMNDPNWRSRHIPVTPLMIVMRTFNRYKKRVFTPVELYVEIKDKECVAKSTLKACMENNFPRISVSKTSAYYGHEEALNALEKHLKQNKIEYTRINK